MNRVDIISVDPGQSTLGSLHAEFSDNILRDTIHIGDGSIDKDLVNFAFGSSSFIKRHGLSFFVGRTILATLMIVLGCLIFNGSLSVYPSQFTSVTCGVSQILIGSLIAIGFLTRFATFAGFAGFGYLTINAIGNGMLDITSLLCCIISLTFLILGAGKFSSDFIIRKALLNYTRGRRSKIAEQRLSYKAYRYCPYR